MSDPCEPEDQDLKCSRALFLAIFVYFWIFLMSLRKDFLIWHKDR